MKITEKLKGILSDEEIQKFESSVQTLISEQVEARLATEVDGIKKKYDTVAEEYCKKMINEGIEEGKKALVAEYDQKMLALEDKVVKGLDLFLEQEILPQVSEKSIQKIAINEAFAPIVTGMKKLFEENYIAIDTEGSALLSEAKQEITNLKNQLSESISDKMGLNERLEKVANYLLISESTNGLNTTQKKRVSDMFKDKSFEETEGKIKGFVQFICESEVKKGTTVEGQEVPKEVLEAGKKQKGLLKEEAEVPPTPEPKADPVPEVTDENVAARADRYMA